MDRPQFEVLDGALTISIPIEQLKGAFARGCPYFDECERSGFQPVVTDAKAFAESVARHLNEENPHSGITPFESLLDKMFEQATEWGDDGVELFDLELQ